MSTKKVSSLLKRTMALVLTAALFLSVAVVPASAVSSGGLKTYRAVGSDWDTVRYYEQSGLIYDLSVDDVINNYYDSGVGLGDPFPTVVSKSKGYFMYSIFVGAGMDVPADIDRSGWAGGIDCPDFDVYVDNTLVFQGDQVAASQNDFYRNHITEQGRTSFDPMIQHGFGTTSRIDEEVGGVCYDESGGYWRYTMNDSTPLKIDISNLAIGRHMFSVVVNPDYKQEEYNPNNNEWSTTFYVKNAGPAAPFAPTLSSKTASSITVRKVSGQEYSIDNGANWNDTGTFTGLSPETAYSIITRVKATDTTMESANSAALAVTTYKAAPAAPSAPTFSSATSSSITINMASNREYKLNNGSWQTSGTFTGLSPKTAYSIYARIPATSDTAASDSSSALTAYTLPATPVAPTVSSNQPTSITLSTVSGQEYRRDSGSWQTSGKFTGLSPNTQYSFYTRVKAASPYAASGVSSAKTVTTPKYTASVPDVPTLASKTDTTITVNAVSGQEYRISDGSRWQDSGTFTGLRPNVNYSIITRTKETDTTYASAYSSDLLVTTKQSAPAKPAAPTVKSVSNGSFEVNTVSGQQYSRDGGATWQTSGVFTGVSPESVYQVITRIPESDTRMGSANSDALTVYTAPNAPGHPELIRATDSQIVIKEVAGIEYNIDGGAWQDSGTFTGLSPNTTYDIRARVKASGNVPCSEVSDVLSVTTDKRTVAAPAKPTFITKTDTKIVVEEVPGQEYRIGNGAWQSSGTFTGLTPNATYFITTRIGETETDHASAASESLSVTTKKSAPGAPGDPWVKTRTDTVIAIEPVAGQEYRLGNGEWQDTATFSGLMPNTDYVIYMRIAETDDTMPGITSEPYTVRTKMSSSDVAVPNKPVVRTRTDHALEVVKTEGVEYSIDDGENWSETGVFSDLAASSEYSIIARVAETDTAMPSGKSAALVVSTKSEPAAAPAVPVVTTRTDSVIAVDVVVGQEYSIDDGATWNTTGRFDNLDPQTDHRIVTRVAETETAMPSHVSEAVVARTKYVPVDGPSMPSVMKRTDRAIELHGVSGAEYSINDGDWTTETVFEGLEPNTLYSIMARFAETDEAMPSEAVGPVCVLTKQVPGPAPTEKPVVTLRTDDVIEVTSEPGQEYSIDDGTTWQETGRFEDLDPAIAYRIVTRYAETNEKMPSETTEAIEVATKSAPGMAPAKAPALVKRTDTMIELVKVDGWEYSIDGGRTWQESNIFRELDPDTDYEVIARVAETDGAMPSAATGVLEVKTKKRLSDDVAVKPIIVLDRNDTSVIVEETMGQEYWCDNEDMWKTSGVFEDLEPGTEYTIMTRIAETEDTMASERTETIYVVTKYSAPGSDETQSVEIIGRTDTGITVKETEGQEYSIDGGQTWRPSGEFTGLDPEQEYEVITRIAETEDTMPGEPTEPVSTSTKRPLPDDVETVPVEVIDKTDTTITVKETEGQEYSIDGGNTWQPGGEFTDLDPDKEYEVITRVAETEDTMPGEPTEPAAVKTKRPISDEEQAGTKPVEIIEKTDTTIKVKPIVGQEYSIDGGNTWTSDGKFTGLDPNEDYDIITRVAETEDTMPGEPLDPVQVTTKKSQPDSSDTKPVEIVGKTDTSITVKPAPGQEYSIDGGKTWQPSGEFTDLEPGKEYEVITRIAETEDSMPGESTEPVAVVTKRPLSDEEQAKTKPVEVISKTDTSITVKETEGQEYSIDGGQTWQPGGTFTDIDPDKEYEIITRIEGTDTTLPGEPTAPVTVKTKKPISDDAQNGTKPVEIIDKTDTSITVKETEGQEYSIDGGETWQPDGTFTDLDPDKEYEVITRVAETEDTMPGEPTEPVIVKTKKTISSEVQATTKSVEVADRTDTAIIVRVVAGQEYSIDNGKTWQAYGLFEALKPDTQYGIITRIAETEDTMPGKPTEPVIVKTKKQVIDDPSKPTLVERTNVSITVESVEGYEYGIAEGAEGVWMWQDDGEFTDLTEETAYRIVMRKAATEEHGTGPISEVLDVWTKGHFSEDDEAKIVTPVVASTTSNSIKIETAEGQEYALRLAGEEELCSEWQTGDTFTGLKSNTKYEVLTRLAATNDKIAGKICETVAEATTAKAPVIAPVDNEEVHTAYVHGYPDGTVRPNGKVTREEAAQMLYHVMGLKASDTVKSSYSDVKPTHWSYKPISALTEKGVLSGYENGSFKPTTKMTRAEFVSMLVRWKPEDGSTKVAFTDVSGHWAEKAINRAASMGWISGYGNGKFKPNATITRAEAMAILNRAAGRRLKDTNGVTVVKWPDNKPTAWYYNDVIEASTDHTGIMSDDGEVWKK